MSASEAKIKLFVMGFIYFCVALWLGGVTNSFIEFGNVETTSVKTKIIIAIVFGFLFYIFIKPYYYNYKMAKQRTQTNAAQKVETEKPLPKKEKKDDNKIDPNNASFKGKKMNALESYIRSSK